MVHKYFSVKCVGTEVLPKNCFYLSFFQYGGPCVGYASGKVRKEHTDIHEINSFQVPKNFSGNFLLFDRITGIQIVYQLRFPNGNGLSVPILSPEFIIILLNSILSTPF